MKDLLLFIIFLIVTISTYNYSLNRNIISLKHTDNHFYKVKNDSNKYKKLEVLSKLNNSILLIIQTLKNNYPNETKYNSLYDTYNAESLSENLDKDYTAYSLNKGQEISVCLIDEHNNIIDDHNTLLFVIIHELAHIITPELGHTPLFWNNMSSLLKVSIDNNIYNYVDYSKNPVMYCGVLINRTPYTI